jgi:hypothetical protein
VEIAWGTLAAIAAVAAAAALTVVLLVAFAIVGLSTSSAGRVDDSDARARRFAGTAVAVLCLLAAGLIVCYSLYLIIA